MSHKRLYSISLITAFLLGYFVSYIQISEIGAQETPSIDKLAYLIYSTTILKPDQIGPYVERALPLAQQAGLVPLASAADSTVHVLEGEWPYKGNVAIQRYDSMDALLGFWNSSEYQEAKKLRKDVVDVDFIIALEAH